MSRRRPAVRVRTFEVPEEPTPLIIAAITRVLVEHEEKCEAPVDTAAAAWRAGVQAHREHVMAELDAAIGAFMGPGTRRL